MVGGCDDWDMMVVILVVVAVMVVIVVVVVVVMVTMVSVGKMLVEVAVENGDKI